MTHESGSAPSSRAHRGLVPRAGFYGDKGGAGRGVLTKEKPGLFVGQDTFSLGRGREEGFYYVVCLFSLWGMERTCPADYLTGA